MMNVLAAARSDTDAAALIARIEALEAELRALIAEADALLARHAAFLASIRESRGENQRRKALRAWTPASPTLH